MINKNSSTPLADKNLHIAWSALNQTMQRVSRTAASLRATVDANREALERARLLDIKLSERRDRRADDAPLG